MATKQEIIEGFWVPVCKRLPPDDPLMWVAVYVTGARSIQTRSAAQAHVDGERFLEEMEHGGIDPSWAWDRVYSHWMPLYAPLEYEPF